MEQGTWDDLYQRFLRLVRILEGDSEAQLFTKKEYADTYTIAFNILKQRPSQVYSQQLYDKYKGWLKEYVVGVVLRDLRNKDGEVMLEQLVKRWENHNVMVKVLSFWFRFLDRCFVKINYLTPLREVGLMCFREHVYHEIKATARNAVLALIHKEREGERIADWSLLKNVINFFVDIGMNDAGAGVPNLYENDFEAHMLEDTRNYYSRKAASWISLYSLPDFLRNAEEGLKQEEERVAHYNLHYTTKDKLLEIIRNELLSHYPTQLVENEHSGCPALLRDCKKDDLSRMYKLFSKISNVNVMDTIANSFIQQLTTEGRTIAKQAKEEDSNALVRNVIELQDRYVEYVVDAFQKNSIISNAFKQAFEAICGNDVGGSTFAEILAIFCDNLLGKGRGHVKNTNDEEVENMLEKVVKLVRYISDKDVFGEIYRKKLASRMLSDEIFNDSIEQNMIAMLKEQNGIQYTSKMEFMIKDLAVEREGKSAFEEYLGSGNINLGIELRVKVLTTPFWPTFQLYSQPNLPSDIANCVQVFKAYYSTQNEHRKLTWIYSLGTCNISGNFDNEKEIEMIVSTYQAMILLLFNDHEKLSCAEIKSQLNLTNDKHVDRHLHSMACSKYKILLKQPNTKVVLPADTFEVNPNFSSKSKRIQIPYPPPLEEKEVIKSVENERQNVIEACIVRIMKSRKVLHHSKLVMECIDQLKSIFKPNVNVIEKQINSLVSKDFLEPDAENPQILKYVP